MQRCSRAQRPVIHSFIHSFQQACVTAQLSAARGDTIAKPISISRFTEETQRREATTTRFTTRSTTNRERDIYIKRERYIKRDSRSHDFCCALPHVGAGTRPRPSRPVPAASVAQLQHRLPLLVDLCDRALFEAEMESQQHAADAPDRRSRRPL